MEATGHCTGGNMSNVFCLREIPNILCGQADEMFYLSASFFSFPDMISFLIVISRVKALM